jgi:hypothetical protein
MFKALFLVSAFPAAILWSQAAVPTKAARQDSDSVQFAPVSVTSGQTLRIDVSSRAPGLCVAQLGFLDSGGKPIGPNSSIVLEAGEFASLELPSIAVAAKPGQRVEIRPWLVPGQSTVPSACQASVSVLDATAERSPQEVNEAEPAGGKREGIHVHGHWTIDVRNRDGTLATHREFENSLTAQGAQFLVNVLSSADVPGFWIVGLYSSSVTGPCFAAESGIAPPYGGLQSSCFLAELNDTIPWGSVNPSVFKTLTISEPTSGTYNRDLLLSGSFTAPLAGSFQSVFTAANLCAPTVLPASCNDSVALSPVGFSSGYEELYQLFTSTTFQSYFGSQLKPNPIPVATGQLVQVTVAISFM